MQKINYPSITKFQQLVELKDYRKPTKKEYVRYVRKLAEHFQEQGAIAASLLGPELALEGGEGELAARARLLNQPFRKHARTGIPWVLFKSAMTLDGKIATASGESKWITGEAARAEGRTVSDVIAQLKSRIG